MLKSITLYIARSLEAITEWTGKIIAWLTLLMVLAVITVLILRNIFHISAIPLQESVSYMHAIIFMLGAAFTLKHNDHVRVDVFYQTFSDKTKAVIDSLGFLLLLLPVSLFIFIYCIDYVVFNWELKEGSNQIGGLPYLYLLKSLLIIMPIALILQGMAQLLTNISFLIGWIQSPYQKAADPILQDTVETSHV